MRLVVNKKIKLTYGDLEKISYEEAVELNAFLDYLDAVEQHEINKEKEKQENGT